MKRVYLFIYIYPPIVVYMLPIIYCSSYGNKRRKKYEGYVCIRNKKAFPKANNLDLVLACAVQFSISKQMNNIQYSRYYADQALLLHYKAPWWATEASKEADLAGVTVVTQPVSGVAGAGDAGRSAGAHVVTAAVGAQTFVYCDREHACRAE